MTGTKYPDLLEEFHTPLLEEEGPNDMLLQEDEATDLSHRVSAEKCIGKSGPISWPPL